ncbi:hypothetical protein AMTR_s00016p00219440 [Amborella trichopoda]|uniref:Pentacotripeptide-repeat region of PRORP domain-containing protein n=1 Tax=Amborella trichopoda TaxID=13333 RepID=W1PGR8_AMBTC|nr:hypothetical protein AMTR_s00016p00219440 [Amborella trichopoda]
MTSLTLPICVSNSSTPNVLQLTGQEYLSTLQTPKNLKELKTIHAQLIKTSLIKNHLLLGKLLCCCSMSNSMAYAQKVFDEIPRPNVFFCNVMIKGYSESGSIRQAMNLYSQMRFLCLTPDAFTFPAVLKCCSDMLTLKEGRGLHGLVVKLSYCSDVIVQTALIDMYSDGAIPLMPKSSLIECLIRILRLGIP